MWHELETLHGKKPLIVSMGDVAASGGYYIAMGANRIIAEPGTLTGSIGVVGGKIALEKFFAKVGDYDERRAKRKERRSLQRDKARWTDTEHITMQKMMNDIYAQFTKKAATGHGV